MNLDTVKALLLLLVSSCSTYILELTHWFLGVHLLICNLILWIFTAMQGFLVICTGTLPAHDPTYPTPVSPLLRLSRIFSLLVKEFTWSRSWRQRWFSAFVVVVLLVDVTRIHWKSWVDTRDGRLLLHEQIWKRGLLVCIIFGRTQSLTALLFQSYITVCY